MLLYRVCLVDVERDAVRLVPVGSLRIAGDVAKLLVGVKHRLLKVVALAHRCSVSFSVSRWQARAPNALSPHHRPVGCARHLPAPRAGRPPPSSPVVVFDRGAAGPGQVLPRRERSNPRFGRPRSAIRAGQLPNRRLTTVCDCPGPRPPSRLAGPRVPGEPFCQHMSGKSTAARTMTTESTCPHRDPGNRAGLYGT